MEVSSLTEIFKKKGSSKALASSLVATLFEIEIGFLKNSRFNSI